MSPFGLRSTLRRYLLTLLHASSTVAMGHSHGFIGKGEYRARQTWNKQQRGSTAE